MACGWTMTPLREDEGMQVVSFVTQKGGSGKSTEGFVLDFQSNSAASSRTAMAVRIERITLV